jgi:hypothetical protein
MQGKNGKRGKEDRQKLSHLGSKIQYPSRHTTSGELSPMALSTSKLQGFRNACDMRRKEISTMGLLQIVEGSNALMPWHYCPSSIDYLKRLSSLARPRMRYLGHKYTREYILQSSAGLLNRSLLVMRPMKNE